MLSRTLALSLAVAATLTPLLPSPSHAANGAEPTGDFSIVNGQEVNAADYPEVVRLVIQTTDGLYASCGGTLLDSEWVLSAAHCFEDMRRGSTVVVKTYTGVDGQGKAVEDIKYSTAVFAHPSYAADYNRGGRSKGKYDVALVRLPSPIQLPNGKQVPTANLVRAGANLPRSGNATVVGRGAHTWVPPETRPGNGEYISEPLRLRAAEVPLLADCQSPYQVCAQRPIRSYQIPRGVDYDELKGNAFRNPSSCYGDSGGPLFVTENGERRQIGIVSHHRTTIGDELFFEGDVCGRATVWYTSISFVRPWIDAVKNANLTTGQTPPTVPLPVPPYASGNAKPQAPNTPKPPVTPPNPRPKPPANPPSGRPQPRPVPPGQQTPPGRPGPVPVPPVPAPPRDGNPSVPDTTNPGGAGSATLPSQPGDGALLQRVPVIRDEGERTEAAIWSLDGTSAKDGSDLAIGAARLRAASPQGRRGLSGNRVALLASEDRLADALASGPLQAVASLYLTQSNTLEPAVAQELSRVGYKEVWLLGGEAALSPTVEQQLQNAGIRTRRIAGANRVQTAIAINKMVANLGIQRPDEHYIARAYGDRTDEGRAWADSLALGALAANRRSSVLLTTSSQLSPKVREAIKPGDRVTIVGGEAAVSDTVRAQLQAHTGAVVGRISGATRASTASFLADQFEQPKQVVVIDGQSAHAWQVGFALAGLAGDLSAPVLLTMGDTIPVETQIALSKVNAKDVVCVGKSQVCQNVVKFAN